LLKNFFFSEVYYLVSQKLSNKLIFVIIADYEGGLVINRLNFFYKQSSLNYVGISDLKRYTYRDKSVYLLSTSEGILNSIEAMYIGVGGVLLFEYY
jgi:ribosomal protein S8